MRRYSLEFGAAGIVAGAIVLAATIMEHGTGAEAWRLAARFTARASFVFFMAVYLVSPLSRVWRPAFIASALRQRRGLGLAFAGAHSVHFVALASFVVVAGQHPSLLTLLGGGFGYVVIVLMAATSNDWSLRTLGPRLWGGLHRFGLHYLWFIFAFTLLGRVLKPLPGVPNGVEAAMLAALLAGAMLRAGLYAARLFAAPGRTA